VLSVQAPTGDVKTLRVRGVPVLEPDNRVRLVVKVVQDITDERRLQEQQAASTRLLREVVNNLATFVGVVTVEGILTEANDAALRAANLQPEDVLGKHFAETYWWSYDPAIQQQLREAIALAGMGERVRYDVLVRLGPNSAITIDFMLAPVFDEGGQVKYLVASGIDITARIKLTQQLDEQQRRYHTILNSLPGIVYEGAGSTNAAEQKMTFVSKYAEALLGYPMARWTLSDNFWREIVHPDDWDAATSTATETYQTGRVGPVPFRCYTADGRLLYLEAFNAPITDENGELIGTCGVVMDVSQRHQQEQEIKRLNAALAVQRQRLEQIIANMPGIVYEAIGTPVDGSYKLTYISAYVETMLGYTPTELIAQPELWQEIILAEDWPELIERITNMYPDATSGSLRFRAMTRDHQLRHVELHASILRNHEGVPVGAVGVMMDVTQRQQHEAAIQRYAAELSRSNAELEQFAYVASHDLQEPLRMVTSYLQLVEQRYADKLDADGKEFINYAVDGASRMKELINDLLAYSRIQRTTGEWTQVPMQDVFERVVHNLQLRIEDTQAEVTSDPLPVVTANRVQMVQLLQNLIGNALKFSADRPPRVHVGVEQQGAMWRFAVSDNGIGIEQAYLERIFVIFQRLHTREQYEGTGIGLAICRRIVEKHGGQITVESTPGEGSTFYFTLPMTQPERTLYDGAYSNPAR
jgi:PAS domain S-box-containing protein